MVTLVSMPVLLAGCFIDEPCEPPKPGRASARFVFPGVLNENDTVRLLEDLGWNATVNEGRVVATRTVPYPFAPNSTGATDVLHLRAMPVSGRTDLEVSTTWSTENDEEARALLEPYVGPVQERFASELGTPDPAFYSGTTQMCGVI